MAMTMTNPWKLTPLTSEPTELANYHSEPEINRKKESRGREEDQEGDSKEDDIDDEETAGGNKEH
jgi:hypothetical protein